MRIVMSKMAVGRKMGRVLTRPPRISEQKSDTVLAER
jgi:hypothetical protein